MSIVDIIWKITKVFADALIVIGLLGAIETLHLAFDTQAFENRVKWFRQRKQERETREMVRAWCAKRYGR